MNYYISRNYKDISGAGNKAKTDIEQIMDRIGFKNVGLPMSVSRSKIKGFFYTLASMLKGVASLHRNDILVLQYPLKKYFSFVCDAAHLRGAKVVVVIHDLGSFRRKALTVEKEIRRLNRADYIIAHNESMKQWLIDNGCKAKLATLGIFDYLSPATPSADAIDDSSPRRIVYAGGLSPRKNKFLYEIGKHLNSVHLNLYGGGFVIDEALGADKITYKGFASPDSIIANPMGEFGLVWDGFTINECSGDFGDYLRYNNPHKVSLYLRCGLPVIMWNKAALAPFVKERGLGVCVDSLADIDKVINSISAEEYHRMSQNVRKVADEIAAGHFITEALQKAVAEIG
jgi:hypothetical protein